jgi:hypothetical protein
LNERFLLISNFRRVLNVLWFLLASSFYTHLPAYEDGRERVPKRRHITFRRRGITQKKSYVFSV